MKNPLVHVYITDNHCYCYLLSVDSDSFALLRLRCVVMKIGLVMVEYQDLETHLKRIKDFTGSQVRMSNTMSLGTGRGFSVGRDFFVGGSI